MSLSDLEFILLELFLELGDLFFTLTDSRLKLITLLLLCLREIGGLLLFAGFKLYSLSFEHIVAFFDVICIFLTSIELLHEGPQLILMVSLLLLGLLKPERLIGKSLNKINTISTILRIESKRQNRPFLLVLTFFN